VLRIILAHKRSLWRAAGFICIALATVYLFGWPVSVADLRHVSLAKNPPEALSPRPSFKDCENCPEMITLPAGEFMMGSPEGESGHRKVEGLPRHVVIAKQFAIGRFEVTVNQFSAFVAETGMMVGRRDCRI
jgi:formylglycine-generating enzyme required for sulfatase activity